MYHHMIKTYDKGHRPDIIINAYTISSKKAMFETWLFKSENACLTDIIQPKGKQRSGFYEVSLECYLETLFSSYKFDNFTDEKKVRL